MIHASDSYYRKLIHWAPVIVVAMSFLIVGCYTILQHPVTAEEGQQDQISEAHPQEYYRQNCIECHADYSEFPYGYFYGDYPDYYFEYPRWGYYYAYPWWWDQHWYSSDDEGEAIVEGAKAQRRGSLVPPYVNGSPAIITGGNYGTGSGGGYVAPGATVPGGKPNTGGSTGAGGEQNEKTRVRMTGTTDSTGTAPEKDATTTKATRRGGTKP